jgi:hypothetical protein
LTSIPEAIVSRRSPPKDRGSPSSAGDRFLIAATLRSALLKDRLTLPKDRLTLPKDRPSPQPRFAAVATTQSPQPRHLNLGSPAVRWRRFADVTPVTPRHPNLSQVVGSTSSNGLPPQFLYHGAAILAATRYGAGDRLYRKLITGPHQEDRAPRGGAGRQRRARGAG